MTLPDPLSIPPNHTAFRTWFLEASFERERLDELHYEILTNYWRRGNDHIAEMKREIELCDLMGDVLGLKYASDVAFELWKQFRDQLVYA
jgi:hypothetical protein